MRNMTDAEIKKMVGIEFLYVFSDRSEIPAVVAAFDPKIGFTCLATDTISSTGQDLSHMLDRNKNICLVGYSSNKLSMPHKRREVSFILRSIKNLGHYKVYSDEGFGYIAHRPGGAHCSF